MSPIERSGGGGSSSSGPVTLQYDFTVTGAAKASIDTNVDGASAGLFPTTGKLMAVYFMGRTDEAAFVSGVNIIANNDTGANYNRAGIATSGGGSPAQFANAGQNNWNSVIGAPGASSGLNVAAASYMTFPAYADTTLQKAGTVYSGHAQNATAGQYQAIICSLLWTSTSAITRLKFTVNSGANFVVGSRVTIYIYS